jgi:hypothetical protein
MYDSDRLDAVLFVRLTREEKDALSESAQSCNVTRATLVRELLRRHLGLPTMATLLDHPPRRTAR